MKTAYNVGVSNDSLQQADGDTPAKRRWYQVSKGQVWLFLGTYCLCFLLCRFDVSRHHPFEHPMTNRNAAIWGLVATVVVLLIQRLRSRP
jgi:hypothetical protein